MKLSNRVIFICLPILGFGLGIAFGYLLGSQRQQSLDHRPQARVNDNLLLPGVSKVYYIKDMRSSGLYTAFIAERLKTFGQVPDMPMIASEDLGPTMISAILSKENLAEAPPVPLLVSLSGIVLTNEFGTPLYLVDFELIGWTISIYSADSYACKSDEGRTEFYYYSIGKLAEYTNMKATKLFIDLVKKHSPDELRKTREFLTDVMGKDANADVTIKQALDILNGD